MNLKTLKLRHFKGIKELTLDFNGKNSVITGGNATGKTTVIDSFLWLMTDKNSEDKSDFGIKTLENGVAIPGLEHEVEAEFMDGLKLRKIFKEKWTKKRGTTSKEMTGHTTDYFIDGVPVKKKEYQGKIAGLFPSEQVFRILSDVNFFNNSMKWQDRRSLFLSICGDVEYSEVISSNPDLSELSEILGARTVEDHTKVLKADRTRINKEIENIPSRIDEVSRGVSHIEKADVSVQKKTIDRNKRELVELDKIKADLEEGSGPSGIRKQVSFIEADREEKRVLHTKKQYKLSSEYDNKFDSLKKIVDVFAGSIDRLESDKEFLESRAKELGGQLAGLRAEFKSINSETLPANSEVCPTCEQALPTEKVGEIITAFNANKSFKLEKNKNIGTETAKLKGIAETNLIKIVKDIAEKLDSEKLAKKNLDDIREDEPEKKVFDETPFAEKIAALKKQTEGTVDTEAVEKAGSEIKYFASMNEELEKTVLDQGQLVKAETRITELTTEQRKLSAEYEGKEKELFLCEEFTRARVSMLEGKISLLFKHARFKMFEEQINGGLSECCEVMFQGIPYSDLNNAARINVGLDIINTLSKHYELEAPVFVDNAESVNILEETTGQTIALYVTDDNRLKIEVK
jgi:DNA repair ATPase RecN